MPFAQVPTSSSYSSGPLLTSELTGDVSNAVAWFSYPPTFIGAQTANPQIGGIPDTTPTNVQIDTEYLDNEAGHTISSFPARYICKQPGYYLIEGSAVLNYTGSAGHFAAGFQGFSAGSAFGPRMGEAVPNVSSFFSASSASHLIKQSSVGNDFIELCVVQTTGASQSLFNDTTNPGRVPYLSAMWISSLTGTIPNTFPPVDLPFPTPNQSFLTSSFMNIAIHDSITFLTFPPIMQAQYNDSGSVSSQATVPFTGNPFALHEQDVDNYSAFNGITWTCPAGGLYYAYGQFGIVGTGHDQAVAAGLNVTSIGYNNGNQFTFWGGAIQTQGAALFPNSAIVRRRLRLFQGDTVQLAGFYNSDNGSSAQILNTSSFYPAKLIMIWRSA